MQPAEFFVTKCRHHSVRVNSYVSASKLSEIVGLTDFARKQAPHFSRTGYIIKWKITYYPLATATLMNILIAAALCYLLSRCRTGFQRQVHSLI